ncbi:MAG: hypothetical protein ACRD9L_16895, partial [Bryobacteraceae bacterium]
MCAENGAWRTLFQPGLQAGTGTRRASFDFGDLGRIQEKRRLAIHSVRQVMSTRTGISFFTGSANSDGGSILK